MSDNIVVFVFSGRCFRVLPQSPLQEVTCGYGLVICMTNLEPSTLSS